MNRAKKIFTEKFGEGKYLIEATLITSGKDMTIIINGGTDYHIGAVTFVSWESSSLEKKESAQIGTLKASNHKEDELCKKYALLFSQEFSTSVVVAAGIHIDNASAHEINQLLNNTEVVLDVLANRLKQEKEQ